jgi:AcrR family transcriptional regulator
MTPRGARQRPGEETERLLTDATRRLLTKTPPEGITIRAIGAEAGVQFSLVNRYFGTKDDLIRHAVEETMADWILAIVDGPADTLLDRAVGYLGENSIDVATIRSAISDEASFPTDRFPVLDAVVDAYTQAGQPVERIDVIAALSLIVGWASGETRWIQASGMPGPDARTIIVGHAKRCLNAPPATEPTTQLCSKRPRDGGSSSPG